jgi:hypothetical protein
MTEDQHVTIIAQLRQIQRLLNRGNLTIAEALELVKVYEQGVASLLTGDELIKYIEQRLQLASSYMD